MSKNISLSKLKKNIYNNKHLGDRGEEAAVKYLKNSNFIILQTNYKTKHGEIDIIAQDVKDYDCICFIEVKTRNSFKKGLPKESVIYSKQKKIINSAIVYLKKNQIIDKKIRFDVIEVNNTKKGFDINFIKHAFYSHQ